VEAEYPTGLRLDAQKGFGLRTPGRRIRYLVVITTALAAAIVGVLAASPTASAATCPGTAGRPVKVGAGANVFTGVAMVSRCEAWGVGSFSNRDAAQTLVEHWNGAHWKHVKSPNPGGPARADSLAGVAATSRSDAWTVGAYFNGTAGQTLVEHWSGSRWRVVASPNPGGPHRDALSGVSARSATDAWAVGSFSNGSALQTLVLHWNGTRWTRVPSPNPGGNSNDDALTGVAARSPGDAWAVGWFYNDTGQRTLIEHWDGERWARVHSPNPSSRLDVLTGVTATGPSNAWAVGYVLNDALQQRTLIAHWNGARWIRQRSANRAGPRSGDVLNGVAASSRTNAWAVGYSGCCVYRTLIEHWHGTAWSIQPSANPGGPSTDNVLNGVSVRPRSRPLAVGRYAAGLQARAFALRCC
jgi:hypothetical protein